MAWIHERTPKNVMIDLAEWWFMMGKNLADPRPGGAINRLRAEDRELLKQLTSEDIADIRWPPFDSSRGPR
jgi:hypothetical protein